MKVLYLADLRSPIARAWVTMAVDAGIDVVAVSSRPGYRSLGVETFTAPLGLEALAQLGLARVRGRGQRGSAGMQTTEVNSDRGRGRGSLNRLRGLNPLVARAGSPYLSSIVRAQAPDVVHALRIPLEAMAMARTRTGVPMVASVWGNDFTLHANRSVVFRRATRHAMTRVDGLHADCRRDIRLAEAWGFDGDLPTLVAPGSGGLPTVVDPDVTGVGLRRELGIPNDAVVVVNPRGVREYVRIPQFLEGLERVMGAEPNVHAILVGLQGHAPAREAIERMAHGGRIHLLQALEPRRMEELFAASDVSVSLTTHDGTPNTLLEAMRAGTFPVVSGLESIREWITPGANGLMADSEDVEQIAAALLRAVRSPLLRAQAATVNKQLVRERADIEATKKQLVPFYETVCRRRMG
ncbi:glycosyltransferase [uncultured Nocardioides sp.]|uniref:glycosyltransferase n=1 Tax=uncultured Nocardioides sp. TaxID=198441 RepID=UPI0026198C28|nr:glycosyltransferase [uncultured Nocardioides sp.]